MGLDIHEKRDSTIPEHQKSQAIRLIDVFVIAPILIYAGTKKELNIFLRISLITIGVTTLIYNAQNYIQNDKDDTRILKDKPTK